MSSEETISQLKNLSFCVFDLETTGGNHKNDKIIEIGLVKIENLKVTEKKSFLIDPEMRIPEFIQKLTSISEKDVKNSPKIEEVMDEVLSFMGDSVLVAHNTSFDVPFFNSVLKRLGKPQLENRSLCTNLMTKYLIPNLMNSNLNYMCRIFNIKHSKAHRALDDAIATSELLLIYLNIFISKGIKKINHLYYPRNRYELDQVHVKNGEGTIDDVKKHFFETKSPSLTTVKGENGIILFSFPSNGGSEEEWSFIQESIKDLTWKTISIKLYGPFIETVIHFASQFNKLDTAVRFNILSYLWDTHLPNCKNQAKKNEEDHAPISNQLFKEHNIDFFVTNHIVPEQLIIYPLISLHHRQELVFRYPGHKKKLLQYINSKSAKISSNKLRKSYISAPLKAFIDTYLLEKKSQEKDLYFFAKDGPVKDHEEFFAELDQFLTKNPNPYKYPREYI